jgi:hypothetical protein
LEFPPSRGTTAPSPAGTIAPALPEPALPLRFSCGVFAGGGEPAGGVGIILLVFAFPGFPLGVPRGVNSGKSAGGNMMLAMFEPTEEESASGEAGFGSLATPGADIMITVTQAAWVDTCLTFTF